MSDYNWSSSQWWLQNAMTRRQVPPPVAQYSSTSSSQQTGNPGSRQQSASKSSSPVIDVGKWKGTPSSMPVPIYARINTSRQSAVNQYERYDAAGRDRYSEGDSENVNEKDKKKKNWGFGM